MNTYLQESLVRARLDEARAQAARQRFARSLRGGRPRARVWLGLALIRLGRALADQQPATAGEPHRVTA